MPPSGETTRLQLAPGRDRVRAVLERVQAQGGPDLAVGEAQRAQILDPVDARAPPACRSRRSPGRRTAGAGRPAGRARPAAPRTRRSARRAPAAPRGPRPRRAVGCGPSPHATSAARDRDRGRPPRRRRVGQALVSLHRGRPGGGHAGPVRSAPDRRRDALARRPRTPLPGRRHGGRIPGLRARAPRGRRGGGRGSRRARRTGTSRRTSGRSAPSTSRRGRARWRAPASRWRTGCAPRRSRSSARASTTSPPRRWAPSTWSCAAACCCTCAIPLRALAAIASVCRGQLLCSNQVDLGRTALRPRSPLMRLDGTSGITQWWIPNAAGHRQMLRAVGFTVERVSRLYAIPFGPAHPARSRRPSGLLPTLAQLLFTRREGVPHTAVLARLP